MAMLASKSSFQTSLGSNSSNLSSSPSQSNMQSIRRAPAIVTSNQSFGSPTASEFSDAESPESAKNWNEDRVCDWLVGVNCGEYVKIFRKNNINGENLLEMDKAVLQEMGIDKIGDRVRLFLNIKKLRTKAYANQKKRNRDSFAGLEHYTPPATGSPRPHNAATRAVPTAPSNKRYSRQFEGFVPGFTPAAAIRENASRPQSRPSSPLTTGSEARVARQPRYGYGVLSPAEISRRESVQGFHNGSSNPSSAVSTSGRRPITPGDAQPQTARLLNNNNNNNSSNSSSSNNNNSVVHLRSNSSIDGSMMTQLPQNQDIIRVISTGGLTKVVRILDCQSCEEVMRVTLRKFGYREDHDRNYCFYVLAGLDPDPSQCRRITEAELWRIIKDQKRPERNRLILRKIHQGEPGEAELQRAASIAVEEAAANRNRVPETVDRRSQVKVQQVLGESFNDGPQHPLSPASFQSGNSAVSAGERERNVHNTANALERPPSMEPPTGTSRSRPPGKKGVLRQFFGQRPPSELITSDLTTYFPDHPREEIDRTARLSLRRSTRLSKVNSRLSVASNLSYTSSIADAPPMPTIADTWLSGGSQLAKVKPLDLGRINSRYRDSVASSMLERVQEEQSPPEPNRKSYVSFRDSGSDGSNVNITDPDGNIVQNSYFEDGSTEAGGSLRDISQALDEDGEDEDEELQSFLAGDSWDDSKWMKGALIGQGSFGSVYLALHAVTGELLAVKQVEAPSPASNSQNDARKKSMIDALKREISLLRDLQHPNIVQYLGASSSAEHLNIFLEYVPGGSVQSMLNSYGALREPLIRNFVRQIVTGLAYLHGREIIHRDIKGANILVDNKGGIKISDFGISKKIEASNLLGGAGNNKNRPSLQGSVFWMAPEVVKQTSYTRKADIWSLGCLIVEMMTGNHPFPDCSQLQAIFKIGGAKNSPTIPDHASEEAIVFLKSAFEVDHTKRPSAEELLFSPFLNSMT